MKVAFGDISFLHSCYQDLLGGQIFACQRHWLCSKTKFLLVYESDHWEVVYWANPYELPCFSYDNFSWLNHCDKAFGQNFVIAHYGRLIFQTNKFKSNHIY